MKQGSFAQGRLCCPARRHYYDPLRLPLGCRPFPGVQPVIDRHAPDPRRVGAEEGLSSSLDNLLTVPRPLRRRVLRHPLQDPDVFHGLHQIHTGSAPSPSRLPAGALTTLQTSLHAADRPVAPPRFDPGLSTGPGGFATGDPGVSPDRTLTGWPSRACVRYVMTAPLLSWRQRPAGRTWIEAKWRVPIIGAALRDRVGRTGRRGRCGPTRPRRRQRRR